MKIEERIARAAGFVQVEGVVISADDSITLKSWMEACWIIAEVFRREHPAEKVGVFIDGLLP